VKLALKNFWLIGAALELVLQISAMILGNRETAYFCGVMMMLCLVMDKLDKKGG